MDKLTKKVVEMIIIVLFAGVRYLFELHGICLDVLNVNGYEMS